MKNASVVKVLLERSTPSAWGRDSRGQPQYFYDEEAEMPEGSLTKDCQCGSVKLSGNTEKISFSITQRHNSIVEYSATHDAKTPRLI